MQLGIAFQVQVSVSMIFRAKEEYEAKAGPSSRVKTRTVDAVDMLAQRLWQTEKLAHRPPNFYKVEGHQLSGGALRRCVQPTRPDLALRHVWLPGTFFSAEANDGSHGP